jgi:hypothetical protein
MERELTVSDLCDVSNTPHKVVWENRYGELPPAKPAVGKRGSRRYTLCQALGVRMARLLESRFGVEPRDLIDLTSRLWHMGSGELAAEFNAGRTCVVCIGRKVSDQLFPPTAVNDFDAALKARGAKGITVFAVSVEHEWNRMMERLTPAQLLPEPEVN